MKYFYSHIIEIQTLLTDLDNLSLSKEEKEQLEHIIHSSAHHAVVDKVLTSLPEHDKHKFLSHLSSSSHETIMEFLKERLDNAEDLIKQAAHAIRDEFHEDVKKMSEKK